MVYKDLLTVLAITIIAVLLLIESILSGITLAMAMIPEEFPEGYFIPGRMAMTCCAEDMAFLGFACEYDKTNTLTNKQWVKVTAKVTKEYFADYGGEGPVLKAVRVEQTKKPKEEVISFN